MTIAKGVERLKCFCCERLVLFTGPELSNLIWVASYRNAYEQSLQMLGLFCHVGKPWGLICLLIFQFQLPSNTTRGVACSYSLVSAEGVMLRNTYPPGRHMPHISETLHVNRSRHASLIFPLYLSSLSSIGDRLYVLSPYVHVPSNLTHLYRLPWWVSRCTYAPHKW